MVIEREAFTNASRKFCKGLAQRKSTRFQSEKRGAKGLLERLKTKRGLGLMHRINDLFKTVQFDFLCGVAAVLIASMITGGIKSIFG